MSNGHHGETNMLPSYAICYSDESGFVDYSEFVAMAINYAIEKEMNLI